ncbi:E3 ubiquitin-protein ligase BRE1-like 1 isoform X2 [Macadamia integrifolia]|uniref:E3 ubiquitin-protein ligase BRE1-like 1 isoform X2 n=1 Tax=Macadamia integrifolia TaxID=60698 RepID=UPI001C4F204B|nr:E3 ubiquitin-protein ligase BRE1-like 1 isoform X2 [Macadamia integrifolia]
MGSTGEPDRKRRHLSSVSPTAAAAKKQPFLPFSEDKKIDTAVLQYQNQKLVQQLEAQKAECSALESKFCQQKEKQCDYDDTLQVVNRSWEQLVDDLESCSIRMRSSVGRRKCASHSSGGASSPAEDSFVERLLETGATNSCSPNDSLNNFEDDKQISCMKTTKILQNMLAAINDLWNYKDGLSGPFLEAFPDDEHCRHKTSNDLLSEVKNLRVALGDLHLKHRKLASEVRSCRDTNAKNKAELRRLTGELECTITELGESNSKLATLKAQRDAAQGAFLPVLNVGGRHAAGDKIRDKQRDLQDMESILKELSDLASSRLVELKNLHKERIEILKQLSHLQNSLKDVNKISSSNAYLLVRDQLEKSKAEVIRYQSLFVKLQVEKDNLTWWEKEVTMKVDLSDVFQRASAIVDSRMGALEKEIQKRIDERNIFETRLKEVSREPGRKEIIAEFKTLVSSLPKDMGIMQSQLNKYKEAASEVHSLRAEVQFLSNILDRKVNELESLSCRSADQNGEIEKLQAVVHDLKESDQELKLILEMYRRESTDSRDILEARDLEYKAWAHVQSLKSSLDEHSLELRVKAANEAEAISQQRLAAAEAEIADLRQKLDASGRDISKLSEILKSKHEEGEAYLSEIESIGQAYEDMQTQNQHLLQQITERDDYNIKLVLEGVRARQLQDALLMEKQTMRNRFLQANDSLHLYDLKSMRIEDQLKIYSEQVQKLTEDRRHSSAALESTQKRLTDVRKESQLLRSSLEESQSKVERSRVSVAELQVELEKERFDKKRVEEELDVVARKATRFSAHNEGSLVVEKLQKEIREYKEILKCGSCHDRPKEVVITKCFHLFCNPCVQRVLETRQRKCQLCSTSFGPNDVKAVYI